MDKLPNIIPISDLRQNAASVVKRAAASRGPLVVTQRGRAAAVIVSLESYERFQHELELLRLFALGEKEIEAGKGHDLDSVVAEANCLLKGRNR